MLMKRQEMIKRIHVLEKEIDELKKAVIDESDLPAKMTQHALVDWNSVEDEEAYAHLQ